MGAGLGTPGGEGHVQWGNTTTLVKAYIPNGTLEFPVLNNLPTIK